MRKAEGLNHAEGFCLMPYICDTCKTGEWLYNTRDGVTPFIIGCILDSCNGSMSHVMAHIDVRARIGHKLGDLQFLRSRSEVWHGFLIATLGPKICGNDAPFEPVDGMRVFVDLTMEKACARVEDMLRRPEYAEHNVEAVQRYVAEMPPIRHDPTHPDFQAFMDYRNELARDWCRFDQGGGAPSLETWPIIPATVH